MTVMVDERLMVCDAHVHLWSIVSPFHQWPDAETPTIHRDFGRVEFAALSPPLTKAILVQAQPDCRETDWLLEIAVHEKRIAGVVGWAALDAADAPAVIANLAVRPKLVGLRPMLQDMHDSCWILRPEVDAGINAMMTHGLRFDALVRPRHLPAILKLARRWPDLPIVIDHAGKPDFSREGFCRWRDDMSALAEMPNVSCKLSGLLTELPAGGVPSLMESHIRHVLDVFIDRVMWGSDWPVLLLSGWSYDEWLSYAITLIRKISTCQLDSIFYASSTRFYDR